MAVAAAFSSFYTDRITDWLVMTDELLYERLALSVAETGSPLPTVHGVHVQVLSMLYPLLIAPAYAAFGMPEALHAVHLWNSVLMASAAIPAYLLARDVVRSRAWALAVSALTASVPWTVLSGFVLTENAAYPAFLWAVLAMQRSLSAPSARADVLALLGLVVAFLARTQFLVLAVVFPLVVVIERRSRRRAVASHRVLALAYGLAAPIALVLALFGQLGKVLGSYSAATGKGLLPPAGVFRAAAAHLDAVAIAVGVVPLLLAAAWFAATLWRPRERVEHAYAALAVVLVAALTFQTAWFDLSFPSPVGIRDRYLFYVAPLLFVGMAAALRDAARQWIGVLAAAVFVAATVHWTAFHSAYQLHLDAVGFEARKWLAARAGDLGLGGATLVTVAVLIGGTLLALGLGRARRDALAVAVTVFVLVVCLAQTRTVFHRLVATPKGVSGRPIAGKENRALAWIDQAVQGDAGVGTLPYPTNASWPADAVLWWDVEFWNERVDRTLLVNGEGLPYTPETFPTESLRLDPFTGTAAAQSLPPYLAVAATDVRLHMAGRRLAAANGVELWSVERPARAEWLTIGLDMDGSTLAGLPPQIRLFGSGARRLSVTLRGVPTVADSRPFTLRGPASSTGGVVPAGGETTAVLAVCIPARGFADVTLSVPETSTVGGPPTQPVATGTREVGVRVVRIESTPEPTAC